MVEQVDPTGFVARLRELIGEESVSRFAAEVGLGDNLVRKYLEGATPGLDKVVRICRAKGVSIAWLALGQGPRQKGEESGAASAPPRRRAEATPGDGGAHEIVEALDGREFVLLPRYDVKVSAGGGSLVHSEQIVDYYAFNRRWFEERVGILPAQVVLLEVHGDSMEPDLFDGDLVLVDTSKTSFVSDAIYVLLIDGTLVIKRVNKRLDGHIEIRSSNDKYGAEVLTPEQAEQLVIVGRARRVLPKERRLP